MVDSLARLPLEGCRDTRRVHGGLSHCRRPQELSFVFVIHAQLLPCIGMLKCPSRLIIRLDLYLGVATSFWCL